MAGQDNNNNISSMKDQPERNNVSSSSASIRTRRFHLDRLPSMSGDLSSSSLTGFPGSPQAGACFCSSCSSRLSRRERVLATLDAVEKLLSDGGDLFADDDSDSSQGSFLSGRRSNQ
jgi:hypothetical protein